jgi:hypothetical protein
MGSRWRRRLPAAETRLERISKTVGNPGFWFQPAGCLLVTTDAANSHATYVFNGCTGPLGLVELTGTIAVDWQTSPALGQLTIHYAAQGFKLNRSTVDTWVATAVLTAAGNAREMTWNATLSGTTRRGRTFVRTNQKDLKWTVGEPCLSVSGESNGTILGRTFDHDHHVSALRRLVPGGRERDSGFRTRATATRSTFNTKGVLGRG